jgi:hypothetical protein
MNSVAGNWELPQLSFLIRKSPDQRLFASFPELIAGYNVLHRLSMPRHPPHTLKSLTTFIDHRHGRNAERRMLNAESSLITHHSILITSSPAGEPGRS